MGKEADVILNVDYGTMCRYERAADGYRLIVDRLTKLRAHAFGGSPERLGSTDIPPTVE
jgi:hypothetical protein